MSDTPQGDGWWEASDGRWYPPEAVPGPDPDATQHWDRSSEPSGPGNYQAPGPSSFEPPSVQPSSGLPPGNFQPPAASPFEPPSAGPPPGYGAPPGGPPPGGYGAPPGGPPPGGYGVPPAGSPPGYGAPGPGGYGAPPKSGGGSRTVWIALAVIAGVLVIGCGGCVALVGIGANSATEGGFEFINELAIDFSNSVPATGPTSCEVTGIQSDGSDDYAVDALVTNESGVTSHYEINYELIGPDGESLGFDFGIVSNVEPGEMVRDFTLGIIDADPDWRDVSCVVTDARRVVAE